MEDQNDLDFESSPLATFLDDIISLVTNMAKELEESADKRSLAVGLMTIHASKGMEFDQVFLVVNEDGTLPTSLGSVALEEERRSCYVAKTELCTTWRREVTFLYQHWYADQEGYSELLKTKKKANAREKKRKPSKGTWQLSPIRMHLQQSIVPNQCTRNIVR